MADLRGYRPVPPGTHPPLDHPGYRSTELRAPHLAPLPLSHTLTEITGPTSWPKGDQAASTGACDLTGDRTREPVGERIIVTGRVVDGDGTPLPHALVEVWQANAAGRYAHGNDDHPAPLDPHFDGAGVCLTDDAGGFRLTTIKPGAYPWRNHRNAWRPAHIHFSVQGPAFVTRLVTQMYFPGDPLFEHDPILRSVPEGSWERLVCRFDLDVTEPEWALGYRWDIVLRGRAATPAGI
jgi:protocatechuate 3,4-dioxygenase beta subunit